MSLYWPRVTRNGALAGMISGGLTVMLWRRDEGPWFEVYDMIPGVLFASAAIRVVSIADRRADV